MSDTANDARTTARPFQFTLKRLFAMTALVALSCAVAMRYGWVGMGYVSIAALGYRAYYYPRWQFLAVFLLYVIIPLTLFGTFVSVAFRPYMHEPDRGNACRNNLRELGMVISLFESSQHEFPRNVYGGDNGQKPYSWRIRVLPYLGLNPAFDAYHFDEAWNAPSNRSISELGYSWRCPCDRDDTPDMTNYLAVVGPHAAWSPDRALTKDDFPDGLANTIFLVDISNSGIHWMEPRDITVEQFKNWFKRLKDEPQLLPHYLGIHVVMGDGRVLQLPPDLSLKTLDALLTRDGGEKIDLENLR